MLWSARPELGGQPAPSGAARHELPPGRREVTALDINGAAVADRHQQHPALQWQTPRTACADHACPFTPQSCHQLAEVAYTGQFSSRLWSRGVGAQGVLLLRIQDDVHGFLSGAAAGLGIRGLAGAGPGRRHSWSCVPHRRLPSCRRRRSCATRRVWDPWPVCSAGRLWPLLTVDPEAPILAAKSIWPNRFGSPSRAGSRLISERAVRPNGARTCPVPARAGHRPANRRPPVLRPSTPQTSPPPFRPRAPTPSRPPIPGSRRQSTRMNVPIPRVIVPTVRALKVLVPTPPGPRQAKVPHPACTQWTSRARWGGSCSSGSSTSS